MSSSAICVSHDSPTLTSPTANMAAAVSSEDFNTLQLLLKAPSKDAVRDVCIQSHRGPSRRLAETTASTLSIPAAQAAQLVQSLHRLSHHVLFNNLSSPEQILALFPESFHTSLKNLITKILLENSPTWRTDALSDQISLPQLKELDWRVDLVTGSDSVSRMSVPTCLVQLKGIVGRHHLLSFGEGWCSATYAKADGGSVSGGRREVHFHGDGGAGPGVSGHHTGRTGTHQRPAVCGRREMKGPLIGLLV
ncbi:COMM domain-containing protein 9 isoform X1 [Micropterus salmoides]|uniref:COMM domain-containing protein 9 isoform X1 n=1 Tax=Micropterus salmoides TaxID=27706 RepID=UPI0018ECF659|nr:COMM domain-containing protein 9 isoform X1 [Micropterus salmoides]